MDDFQLRMARQDDFPAIRALIRAGRINPTGLAWERFVVAFTSPGKVVGCGQVKPHRDGSYELASIVVDEHFRGRGIARAVIEFLLDREPVRPLYLTCRASLRPFYEKFGFRLASAEEMTSYFRAIYRLGWLLVRLSGRKEMLTIMRLNK